MNDAQSRNNLPPPEVVTEEDWSAWLEHPTTKTFREYLRHRERETFLSWQKGRFTGPTADETLQMNAGAIAASQMCRDLLELTAEQINVEMSNDEQQWVGTSRPSGPGPTV